MATRACAITREPLDPAALLRELPAASDGAVLLFLGIVRDHNDGREVDHLDYHAYAPMAEAELRRIVDEAAEHWETGEIAVSHRVGRLEIGEASVVIAVAAPHREAAYAASRYIIEELKRRVPIWKKEGYTSGDGEWLAGNSVPVLSGDFPETPRG